MNVPPTPDYISAIVGYRVWNWDADQLRSLNREAWLPGRALTAKCPKTGHEPPTDDCSCGVYAAKSYQHLQEIIHVESFVHGEVYLWGKVVEHRRGYRSQFAYPKSLVLPSNIDPRLETSRLESLMIYGADISIPNTLLWTKGSGYTSAGFDWLNERRKPGCEHCGKWHGRVLKILQLGDCVTVLGRGIGLAERDDESWGSTRNTVRVRLQNHDLYTIPRQDIVWNCQTSQWEVDLSGYRGAVILPSSVGWKVLCGPREQKSSDKTALLPNPVRHRISTPPRRGELVIMRPREYWEQSEQKQKSIKRPQSTAAKQKARPSLVHAYTEDHPSPLDCAAGIAVERGEIDDFSSTLNSYGHECVDRPYLLCPACEWATRHEKASKHPATKQGCK